MQDLFEFGLSWAQPEDATPRSTEQNSKSKPGVDLGMGQVTWLQCHPGGVPQHILMPVLRLCDAWEGAWPDTAHVVFKHQGQKIRPTHAWHLFAKPQLQLSWNRRIVCVGKDLEYH